MRLVVIGVDDDVDIAVPRAGGTSPSWPLGRARFLEVGESPPPPGLLVGVEHGPSVMAGRAPVRGGLEQPGRMVGVERGPSARGWRAPSLGCRGQPGRIVFYESFGYHNAL